MRLDRSLTASRDSSGLGRAGVSRVEGWGWASQGRAPAGRLDLLPSLFVSAGGERLPIHFQAPTLNQSTSYSHSHLSLNAIPMTIFPEALAASVPQDAGKKTLQSQRGFPGPLMSRCCIRPLAPTLSRPHVQMYRPHLASQVVALAHHTARTADGRKGKHTLLGPGAVLGTTPAFPPSPAQPLVKRRNLLWT